MSQHNTVLKNRNIAVQSQQKMVLGLTWKRKDNSNLVLAIKFNTEEGEMKYKYLIKSPNTECKLHMYEIIFRHCAQVSKHFC